MQLNEVSLNSSINLPQEIAVEGIDDIETPQQPGVKIKPTLAIVLEDEDQNISNINRMSKQSSSPSQKKELFQILKDSFKFQNNPGSNENTHRKSSGSHEHKLNRRSSDKKSHSIVGMNFENNLNLGSQRFSVVGLVNKVVDTENQNRLSTDGKSADFKAIQQSDMKSDMLDDTRRASDPKEENMIKQSKQAQMLNGESMNDVEKLDRTSEMSRQASVALKEISLDLSHNPQEGYTEKQASPQKESSEFEKSHLPPGFDFKYIKLCLLTQFFANLFVNVDMGILPAGANTIKQELDISNTIFGSLGSVVYFGQLTGSIFSTWILSTFKPKNVLGWCLALNMGSLVVFTLTQNFLVLMIDRFSTGLFQVFFCIFFPVWSDVFGNEVQKSQWLTLLLIASPLGVIMGYGMCASLLNNLGWRWAFYFQTLSLVPSMLGIMVIPSKYFDVNGTSRAIREMKKIKSPKAVKEAVSSPDELKETELQKLPITSEQNEMPSPLSIKKNSSGEDRRSSTNSTRNLKPGKLNDENEESTSEVADSDEDLSSMDQTICERFIGVLSNKNYILFTFSITVLYFILTGVQYWMTLYWIEVLGFEESTVFITFGIVSITGPVLGVIVGGSITTMLGGYKSKQSFLLTIACATGCMVCAIPIPYTNGYWANVILLWLLLFFGGAILPSLTGIMLSTVTLSQKTAANSVANLLYNCAGFMPGPFVYGAIDDAYGGGRTAMKFLMFTPCVCISALYLASYFIFRDDVLGFNKHKK